MSLPKPVIPLTIFPDSFIVSVLCFRIAPNSSKIFSVLFSESVLSSSSSFFSTPSSRRAAFTARTNFLDKANPPVTLRNFNLGNCSKCSPFPSSSLYNRLNQGSGAPLINGFPSMTCRPSRRESLSTFLYCLPERPFWPPTFLHLTYRSSSSLTLSPRAMLPGQSPTSVRHSLSTLHRGLEPSFGWLAPRYFLRRLVLAYVPTTRCVFSAP